jgi:hypothetical protein
MSHKMSKVVAGLAASLSVSALAVAAGGAASAGVTPATGPAWHSVLAKGFAGEVTAVTSVRYSGKTAEFAFATTANLGKSGTLSMYSRSGSESWALTPVTIAKAGETAVAATATGPNKVYVFTKLSDGTGRALAGTGHSATLKGGGRETWYTWTVLKTFDGTIGSATVLSPDDIWVFGSVAAVADLGTWHFNGTKWTQVQKIMEQGAAVSANSAWAVAGATVAHFNGSKWSAKDLQGVPEGEYYVSVYASGPSVYLIGSNLIYDKPSTITILQYNGHTWKKVGTAGTGYAVPGAISGDGHGGIWFTTYTGSGAKTEAVHYANGAAGVTTSTLSGARQTLTIAQIPGTAQELAGGLTANPAGKPATYATIYQYN